MIEPENPKKAAPFPLQTGEAFKIYEKDPAPPVPPVIQQVKREKKRSVEGPPKVARLLKLVNEEEDLEAGQPAEAASVPIPVPIEDSEVKVVEVPLMRKRTLKKAAEATAPEVEPVATINVANFQAARKKQIPPPTVPPMADVEAFLANEPVEAIPVKAVKPVAEEPLHAPGGPLPSVLNNPLGSNIQHILEDIDMDSKEFVGIRDDNIGPSTAAAKKTP